MSCYMGQVLIIEDDDDIRQTLAEVLINEGYAVATAANGVEALHALRARAGSTCAIILDLMMPDMDGWHFRAQQLRDPSLAGIPVIIMSGVADPDAAADLDPVAVVGKPLDFDALFGALARHC